MKKYLVDKLKLVDEAELLNLDCLEKILELKDNLNFIYEFDNLNIDFSFIKKKIMESYGENFLFQSKILENKKIELILQDLFEESENSVLEYQNSLEDLIGPIYYVNDYSFLKDTLIGTLIGLPLFALIGGISAYDQIAGNSLGENLKLLTYLPIFSGGFSLFNSFMNYGFKKKREEVYMFEILDRAKYLDEEIEKYFKN